MASAGNFASNFVKGNIIPLTKGALKSLKRAWQIVNAANVSK